MSTCGAIGVMLIAGREVAAMTCGLERGHEVDQLVGLGEHIPGGYREPRHEWIGTARVYPATPHRALLEWTDVMMDARPDADLLDPDETFDVDVDLR